MDSFAFIIHPLDPKRDVSRKFPRLGRWLTPAQINFFSTFFPPIVISEIHGVTSQATGKEIQGWFIACPLTPQRMLELPLEIVYRKIVQAGKKAQALGAHLLGLGAFTSVVGDGGRTVAGRLDIPVTTGNSLTVATAVEALYRAAEKLEILPEQASGAVVGATGAIGRVCARLLARRVRHLSLIGQQAQALAELKSTLAADGSRARLETSLSSKTLRSADLVISATSAVEAVIQPQDLRSGSVVCDVARPRDVAVQVAAIRPDVLVIDGGMLEVPGEVDFHFDFGFPPGKVYACMAETMALTLEGHREDYTLGKELSLHRVEEIHQIARYHGFQLAGFRSFEKAVTEAQITKIKNSMRRETHVPVASFFPGRS